jgi:hypothetical protein
MAENRVQSRGSIHLEIDAFGGHERGPELLGSPFGSARHRNISGSCKVPDNETLIGGVEGGVADEERDVLRSDVDGGVRCAARSPGSGARGA